MSHHTLAIHDPSTNADRRVEITLTERSGQWSFQAHFENSSQMLASGQNLWFVREADALALAEQRAREAVRARAPKAFQA